MSAELVLTEVGEVLIGAEVIEEMTETEARSHVEKMRGSLSITADLVLEAWNRRVWKPLGYRTWEEFQDAEFQEFGLNSVARHTLMIGLRNAGMSQRQIAKTTGASRNTVSKHLGQVAQFEPPETVTGADGKNYPATQPERELAGGPTASAPDASAAQQAPTPPATSLAPTESGDRETPAAPHGSTSVGAPTFDILDEIDPDGKAAAEAGAYRTLIHRELARASGVPNLDPERITEVATTDTWAELDHFRESLDRWFARLDEARPKPFTVINGGIQ